MRQSELFAWSLVVGFFTTFILMIFKDDDVYTIKKHKPTITIISTDVTCHNNVCDTIYKFQVNTK
jgi:hypothetical protein